MTLREKIKITIRGYKSIHGLAPGFLFSAFIKSVLSALLPFINIFMSAQIITSLADKKELRSVLILAGITVLLNLITGLVLCGILRVSKYYNAKCWKMFDQPLIEKIRQMDYEHIEDSAVHAKLQKIRNMQFSNGLILQKLNGQFSGLIQNLFKIIFSVSFVVGAFTTYKTVNAGFWNFIFTPWFAFIFIVYFIIIVILEMRRLSVSSDKWLNVSMNFESADHIYNYYYEYLTNYKIGKDLKIYNLNKVISADFTDTVARVYNDLISKLRKISLKYESLGEIISITLSGIIYAFVALKALFGSFGIGSIVQYVGSLSQLSGGISGFMGNIAILMSNAESLVLYYEFIDTPSKMHKGTLTTEKRADNEYEIEFHNVSFKYPGSEIYALKNLNLKFNIGQRMAVVGMNGSGKTTMIKLLCRLYDPTDGEITLNGIDIKKYDYAEYMDIFSVVFQDFKLFSFTLGQNVATSVDVDGEWAAKCLSMAGLDERLSSMPKGLQTSLYKDFEEDGVEISGGEAQKIALARALYKNAPFIVLDEPTAALDPIAEFEVYSKFNEIVGDKTAIYISHRLSSCRFCDDIAVFHEGELIQRGSHDTLIVDESGKYYELWNAQAQYYQANHESENVNASVGA